LILKHDLNAPLAGLDTVPVANRPPVGIVFWSFRIMVGLGFLMAGLGLFSLLARARGKLYDSKPLHRFALAMAPSGLVAVLAGWVTTEVGRQPWTIQGLLRTAESASPLAAPAVAASLVAFVFVYFAVFSVGILYILKLMAKAPAAHESTPPNIPVRSAGTTPMVALRPGALAADLGDAR
jgi:cytochrome d ubiquinol oxidase subunit I